MFLDCLNYGDIRHQKSPSVHHLVLLLEVLKLHSQKRPSCIKSVGILQQLVITSRYQDALAWLATAYDNLSVVFVNRLVAS